MTSPRASQPSPSHAALELGLAVDGIPRGTWIPVSAAGDEAMNATFTYRVGVLSTAAWSDLEEHVWGRAATLMLRTGESARHVAGVVTGVRVGSERGTVAHPHAFELTVEPRLSLLRDRQACRIFQDVQIEDVVGAVLEEWGIPYRFALSRPYRPWPYCTQYHEADLAFLLRVLADEGLFFFFETVADDGAPNGHFERVVLGDDSTAYDPRPPLAYVDGAPPWDRDVAFAVDALRTSGPTASRIRDYEPNHELHDPTGDAEIAFADGFAHAHRSHYAFQRGRTPGGETSADGARRLLARLRGHTSTVRGCATTARLAPGQVVALHAHPVATLNRDAVVVRTESRMVLPGLRADGSEVQADVGFSFDAAPIDVSVAPPIVPPPIQQVIETATVVGPEPGQPNVDGLGRIKVQFRWDRDRRVSHDRRSCWIRVLQPWAGPGFGAMFTPRAGMEVLVGYLGGDANRPVVLGCLPNSSNPVPFAATDAGRTGFVTRSLDGRGGGNELSFDDAADRECVVLRAERDWRANVRRDRELTVGGDERVTVGGHQEIRVKSRATTIEREVLYVEGERHERVGGDLERRVSGSLHDHVDGTHRLDAGQAETRLAGDYACDAAGDARVRIEGDAVLRLERHTAVLAGRPDRPGSFLLHVSGASQSRATGPLELVSEESITLRCGASALTLGPNGIILEGPSLVRTIDTDQTFCRVHDVVADEAAGISGREVRVSSGRGGILELTSDAVLDGARVRLATPAQHPRPEAPARVPPTEIRLQDPQGAPIAHERFRLTLADGSSRSGRLDAQGEAVVSGMLGPFEIEFADLGEVEAATGEGAGGARVEAQGGDLASGFEEEEPIVIPEIEWVPPPFEDVEAFEG